MTVVPDVVARVARTEKTKQEHAGDINYLILAGLIVNGIVIPFVGGTAVAAAIYAWAKARDNGLKVVLLSQSEASHLKLPPGHPREGVIYVGHPADPKVYYALADFHRITFQHKFAEAVDLLMALGATGLEVEHIAGWSKDFSATLDVGIPSADIGGGATAGRSRKQSSSLLFKAKLKGSELPALPDGLIWYHHEPTWQLVAKGRLTYGLEDFSLLVSYQDDFGINAGLKLQAQKAGLDVGGKFEDHQSTVWRIHGKFK